MSSVISHLKKSIPLKLIWVVFQPNSIIETSIQDSQIIDFHNYSNATEIIESCKPDIILIEGTVEFSNVAFVLAAKTKKITTISLFSGFIWDKEDTSSSAIINRMRILASNQVMGDISNENSNKKLKSIKFILRKYRFLLGTVRKLNWNTSQKISFIIFYSFLRLTKHHPIHKMISGDLNLCYVPKMKKTLLQNGFDDASIFISGNPAFDSIFSEIQNVKKFRKKSSKKFKILFCPAPIHEHGLVSKKEDDKATIEIINQILSDDRYEINIKLHPSSASIRDYKELLTRINQPVNLYQKENLVELLNEHDVMLTNAGSSVIFYGVFLEKPIVYLDFFNDKKLMQLYNNKIMVKCNKFDELVAKIEDARSKKILESDYKQFIENHLGNFDSKSSERIANRIIHLIKT